MTVGLNLANCSSAALNRMSGGVSLESPELRAGMDVPRHAQGMSRQPGELGGRGRPGEARLTTLYRMLSLRIAGMFVVS